VLRILLIILAINLILVGLVLASSKPLKQKALWIAVLLVIPLIGWGIYYLVTHRKLPQNSFKDWESR